MVLRGKPGVLRNLTLWWLNGILYYDNDGWLSWNLGINNIPRYQLNPEREVYGWSIVIHTINLGESFVYPHNQ